MKLKSYEITFIVKTTKVVRAVDIVDAESMAKTAIYGKQHITQVHTIYELPEKAGELA